MRAAGRREFAGVPQRTSADCQNTDSRDALPSPPQGLLHAALRLALLDGGALVVLPLPSRDGELNLGDAMLEVQAQRDQRVPFELRLPKQPADLAAVQEQFALAEWIMIEDVPGFVGRNVQVVQPDFAVLDPGKRVAHTSAAGAQRFHLRSRQDQPSLVGVFQVILKTRSAVCGHGLAVLYHLREPSPDQHKHESDHDHCDLHGSRPRMDESPTESRDREQRDDDPPGGLQECPERQRPALAEIPDVVRDDETQPCDGKRAPDQAGDDPGGRHLIDTNPEASATRPPSARVTVARAILRPPFEPAGSALTTSRSPGLASWRNRISILAVTASCPRANQMFAIASSMSAARIPPCTNPS